MKRLISTQSLVTVAVALGAFAAASVAHARSDVYFSVGVQTPGVSVRLVPVDVYSRQPIYLAAPGHYGHDGGGWRYGTPYRGDIANGYGPGSSRNQWRKARHYGPYGDLDGDGVRNLNDRDRDGDGVRNRFDRAPNNPYRR